MIDVDMNAVVGSHDLALIVLDALRFGGVGFFNLQNPLGNALPGPFAERHWDRSTGVTDPRSFEHQLDVVERSLAALPAHRRAFTFVNIAAVHQPNWFYLPGGAE